MPIPYRSDLQAFLTDFIDHHRGVRLGKMFGLPAGYVGRRLFACLREDGILVRLPLEVARREIRRGASALSQRPDRPMGSWVMYKPRTSTAARRLTPLLEIAARNVAERQVEDMTGVRLDARRTVAPSKGGKKAR